MIFEFSHSGIELDFATDDESRLYILYIGEEKNKRAGKTIPPYQAFEIGVTGKSIRERIGGRNCCHSSMDVMRYVSHSEDEDDNGVLITFVLSDGYIEAQLCYYIYNSVKAVRAYTKIKNVSDEKIGIEYVSSLCAAGLFPEEKNAEIEAIYFRNNWCKELFCERVCLDRLDCMMSKSTSKISASNTGSWSTKDYLPLGAMVDKSGNTIFWQVESNCSWYWEVGYMNKERYLRLSGPCEAENGWWLDFKPGECFESVKVCISFGDSFDKALAEMTAYRRNIASRCPEDRNLPVVFNDYMRCLVANPTTEKLIPLIERAKEIGAEIFCMDAGWYVQEGGNWWNRVGEWKTAEWRFPGGIEEIFNKIRDCGMIGGIWLEPEVMGVFCSDGDELDDECYFVRHNKRVQNRERYQLDFRHPKVIKKMNAVVDRLIDELGIGYFKFDYNIDIGVGTEVDADSFGDGLLKASRAFLDWVDGIKKKYPGLIIENCASGGLRMDYCSLSHFDIQSLTDAEALLPITAVANAANVAVIPEQAGVWVVPILSDNKNTVESFMINSVLKRPVISGKTAELDEERFDAVKKGVAIYKKIRDDIRYMNPFYPFGVQGYGEEIYSSGMENKKIAYVTVQNMTDEDKMAEIILSDIKAANEIYPGEKEVLVCDNKVIIKLKANEAKLIKLYKETGL